MSHHNFLATDIRRRLLLLGGLASLSGMSRAQASLFTRPVTIVVPFDAGGATDIVARLLAAEMSKSIGQPVVVENRPGATGRIGADYVLRQPADGHTLVMMTITTALNAALAAANRIDLSQRMTGAASLAFTPNVLAIHAGVPAKTVAEFLAWARQSGQPLNFGSSGNGGTLHLAGERFKLASGLAQMQHVPYKGSTPALNDLMSGQIQMMFESMPTVIKLEKSGKLRAIAVTSAQRVPSMPELPTLIEQGFPNFEVGSWFGFMARAGTPDNMLAAIDRAAALGLAEPALLTRLSDMQIFPMPMERQKISGYVASEVANWKKTMDAAGVRLE